MKKTDKTPISNRGFNAQFLCTVPRHNPLILDGIIASVDSVRIKYTYSKSAYDYESSKRYDVLDDLLVELDSLGLWLNGDLDTDMGRQTYFKIGNYMRTVTFKLANGNNFAVLVGRYDYKEKSQIAAEAVLDLNPNKIPPEIWHRVARILAQKALKVTVLRFDLAVDIPMARNQLQLVQRPGSGYEQFKDKAGVVTEYTGERSHHAAIKLYDKGADLEEPDLICTRCEITIDPAKYKSISALWPQILTYAPVDLTMDFAELPYEVVSVILHPDLLPILKSRINRNTFAKYRKQIENYGQTYFTLTDDQTQQIDQYVHQYLTILKTAGTTQL